MNNAHIIIAAWNEEKNISSTIQGLQKEGYNNIIVVDDGSKDKTSKIAEKEGATVLKHMINRGQGAALQTGMTYSILNGAEYLIHFDADGQHNPKEIKNLLNPLINKEIEATLGSRFLGDERVPFRRRLTLKTAIWVIWVFYGLKLTDAHNGFRGFTREAARKVVLTSDKMEHASEVIERIKKRNIKYKEIPVNIIYEDHHLKEGRKGQGNFDAINIVLKMLQKKIWE